MKVALTVNDFLDRAELVYGDRVGVIDEPDQPAPSLGESGGSADRSRRSPSSRGRPGDGELTYRRMAELANAEALALDDLGVGFGERVADRVAQRRPAADRVLRRERLGTHPRAGQLPPQRRRDRATSSSTRGASVLLVDPELDDALSGIDAKHRFVLGAECDDEFFYRTASSPEPWDARRGRRPRPSTTRAAPPPGPRACSSRTATSGSTRPCSAGSSGVSDRDVYLHTLPMFHCNGWGMPYAVTGMGAQHVVLRKVDGAEILRRIDAPRRHAPERRAGGGQRGARRGRVVGRADPRRAVAPCDRGRRTAADPHDRARRDRARLGVHPDLRPHRDVAAAHDEPAAGPSTTTSRPRSGRSKLGRAGAPALGRAAAGRRRGRGARPEQRGDGRLLGAARRDRGRDRRRLVPHRRRRHHRRRALPDDLRPQEGRDHLAAARTCRRSRSRTACSRTRRSPRSP